MLHDSSYRAITIFLLSDYEILCYKYYFKNKIVCIKMDAFSERGNVYNFSSEKRKRKRKVYL